MVRLLVLVVLLAPSLAVAGDADDVTKAFSAFIDGVVTNKADMAGVELFIAPDEGDVNDDGWREAVRSDLATTRGMLASSKLKVTKVVVSKGAKSAWIAGEVPGKVTRKKKTKTEPIRVSAFLAKDDKGWRVKATHWSTAEPDVKTEMCGMLDEWRIAPNVAKETLPTVKAVGEALEGDFMQEGGVKPGKFTKVLSDDKNAVVIGSAPKEVFVGGAKIKGIFKKWAISGSINVSEIIARSALGPDGEMMWIAMPVTAPADLCTSYRTLFVLAKEKAGWRIVHHHYSQAFNPY